MNDRMEVNRGPYAVDMSDNTQVTVPMTLPIEVRTATVTERAEVGRLARSRKPRTSLGNYTPAPNRADPVSLLEGQETVRVTALLPVRHARMSVSPFTFYRGSAVIMSEDLGAMENSGIITQLCGDAHLSNFGLFASPDRSVIFDINDFDETNPGPFEWDVHRLAASVVLAGRDINLNAAEISRAVMAVGNSYRTQMQAYSEMADLAVWYDRIGVEMLQEWARAEAGTAGAKRVEKSVGIARRRDMWSAVSKLTSVVEGRRQFNDVPPLLMRIPLDDQSHTNITNLFAEYQTTLPRDRRQLLRRYEVVDFGHKVVGVGSVGLLAFVILLQGRDENDMLVLQVKQAVTSVLEPHSAPSEFELSGQRVVVGQQLMQAASDAFLGWIRGPGGRDYYIRQLRDMKFAPDPATFNAISLTAFASVCGKALARGHARAGDSVTISGYIGQGTKFDRGIHDFAHTYADQVSVDYAAFEEAITSGRIAVAPEGFAAEARFVTITDGKMDLRTGLANDPV